ncbi:AAA family ATPase [Blastococcus sp. CT_GayMR19]|uniref:AAA family ATPase n=1 Tax=Blastococcus sp. CT_GayMR19 TaxID=2559608 RepID=UPI0010743B6E|nr:AAA family ATPase [Blastococcus sp. CT_GayMR19]TFV74904.1 AAA family ATPase [Blastococcus sp. CT_GayMR19]
MSSLPEESGPRTAPAQVELLDRARYPDGLVATLDPEVGERIGAAPGDAVLVRTGAGHEAVVRLAGSPLEDSCAGILRLDALTRRFLVARLGTDVEVAACQPRESAEVGLEVDTAVERHGAEGLRERLHTHLREARTPLVRGAALALPVGPLGSQVVVRVASVDGVGMVAAHTDLRLAGADLKELTHPVNAGLADVGGLGTAVEELREVIQLAITRPEVLTRLGITPARGVVLHGPPGSGKTLLCRSLAGELDAAFYYISGPEVVGSLHGQTEESLRAVFSDAADHAPAIICIDEIEALTRNRRALSSHADLRAVAQLLSLMDGLRRARGVFVVGTTNQVELIDPAFRRPGRFDREIEIAEPDERARLEILTVQSRSMPLSAEARAALPRLAEGTVGFNGADLAAVCQRAGLAALRRITARGGLRGAEGLLATSEAVGVDDLVAAKAAVQPAGVRDAHFVTVPPRKLAGRTPALDRLRQVSAVALGGVGNEGSAAGSGVLLTGRSGAGKTATVATLARELGLRLVVVTGPELASRWLGDTEESVRGLAKVTKRMRPSLLLLDHLEAMAPRRTEGRDPGDIRIAGQLAAILTELTSTAGVMVVGATSQPELVDELVLGATGLRLRVDVPLPDDEDRAAILAAHLEAIGAELPENDQRALAELADGLTPGDLVLAVDLAAALARGTGRSLADSLAHELSDLAVRPAGRQRQEAHR